MPRINEKLAKEIRANIHKFRNEWQDNIKNYHDMMEFVLGQQWTEEESQFFSTYKKVPLTSNKLAPLANHLLGEQRQNTPSIQAVPEEDVPLEEANLHAAIVKEISLDSQAKIVYQNAFQQALIGSYGAFYITTEYKDENSFEQVLCIKKILDATKCFWDCGCDSVTKSDGMWSGFEVRMSRDKFRALYGKKIEEDVKDTFNIDGNTNFADKDSISILHYFCKKIKKENIYELSNKKIVTEQELAALEKVTIETEVEGEEPKELLLMDNEIVSVVNERLRQSPTVTHYVFAGDYQLEKEKMPIGEMLPLFFVDYNSYYDKNGKQITRNMFKDAKDAQRYINYLFTTQAYLLKNYRYDIFIGSKENVRSQDTAQRWRDPMNYKGLLTYDESPSGARPERLPPPELPASMLQQYERAMQDITTSTGMYDTRLGDQGNEIAKVAIDARTRQGSFNTYISFDALNRAIADCAQYISLALPIVYDTERYMNVTLPDVGQKGITLNKPSDEYGTQMENSLKNGKFKIRLQPGASSEGQKQEALESFNQVLQASPDTFQLIADLYAESLPLDNNIELRNRLRTVVSPEVIQAGKTGQPIQQKQQQPDPLLILKMQELQEKQKETQLKQQELMMKASQSQQDAKLKWEQLELQRLETAAMLEDQQLKYAAESQRTVVDQQMNHANNLIKLLTTKSHQPKGNKDASG